MDKQLRGVNLGGWLVLERWMTPSVFASTEARDEYTLMQTPGAKAKVEQHRRMFITEADFRWLRRHGVNAIRIPIGYWVLDGDAPFTAAIKHLDWAVEMAGKYELKVLIDLHGAPESQNGHDHSGRIGRSGWFADKSRRRQTVDILVRLASRYRDKPQVWGLELINEPRVGVLQLKLRRFYTRAYREITKVARPGLRIVFSDAFRPRLMNGSLLPRSDYPVVMDVHWYHFGWWRHARRPLGRYFRALRRRAGLITALRRVQPIIVGEWSAVLSGETMNKLTKDEQRAATQQHIELQLQTYSAADGWFYWSYKTEHIGSWNFRYLVETKRLVLK